MDQRTAISNRLTGQLKLYYPQILVWFEDIDSVLVADLLRRWPTLPELQKARPATLEKFFRQHNGRDENKTQQRIEPIRRAIPATHDEAVIGSIYGADLYGANSSFARCDPRVGPGD